MATTIRDLQDGYRDPKPQVQPLTPSDRSNYDTSNTSPLSTMQREHVKHQLPAFLSKLYGMVNTPETDPWVHWSVKGDSFIIPNSQTLAEQVLGRHFKHNNFASFVRQLNMYGFHKVPHLTHGVLHNDGTPEIWEFTNGNFHRDEPQKMKFIVRKKGEAEKARSAARHAAHTSVKTEHVDCVDPADVAIVRAEMYDLANKQSWIKQEMSRLAANTEELWKYAFETRRRNQEQQEKLENLIKFLSNAFIKRQNAELAPKVRGLLEGPTYEILEDDPKPAATTDQGQMDVLKMLASGKMPAGLQEVILQYLQSHGVTNVMSGTPATATTPSDVLATYQAATSNMQQLANVQQWVENTDQGLQGLGIDMNPQDNSAFEDYFAQSNFTFDDSPYASLQDPSVDVFQNDTSGAATMQTPWVSQYLNSEQGQDTSIIGQKRDLEDQMENGRAKKARR